MNAHDISSRKVIRLMQELTRTECELSDKEKQLRWYKEHQLEIAFTVVVVAYLLVSFWPWAVQA